VEPVDRLGRDPHGGREPDGQVGPTDVVVDRLRDADERDALVDGQPGRRRERALATDDDQPVEAVHVERLADPVDPTLLAVGVDARGPEHRPTAVEQPPRGREGELHHREVEHPLPPVLEPEGQHVGLVGAADDRTDRGVQAGAVPTAGEDADAGDQWTSSVGADGTGAWRRILRSPGTTCGASGGADHVARILSIDEGTTGVRGFVIDEHGAILASGYEEFTQHFPRPGWVEHDADEIWQATLTACRSALEASGTAPGEVTCIGITNQRETTVLWDRATLEPIHHAIVWQDRRTADRCDRLKGAGHGARIRRASGLVIDAYFSGTKVAWLLDEVDGARDRADAGDLAFGTMDTWLVARMTGGREHVTEPSNASRTMLYDVRAGRWSDDLLDLLDVPSSLLPEVRDSAGTFGTSDPEAFLGHHRADHGDRRRSAGRAVRAGLLGAGDLEEHLRHRIVPAAEHRRGRAGLAARAADLVAWQLDGRPTYALEGAIFVTGATVQWLRDQLGIISSAEETETLAAELPDGNEGVYLVPAFTGLGAPHWDQYARAAIVGMTRGTDRRHLAAGGALEAMAYQTVEVVRADGARVQAGPAGAAGRRGAAANDLLCQFQADCSASTCCARRTPRRRCSGPRSSPGSAPGCGRRPTSSPTCGSSTAAFEPTMDGRDARSAAHGLAGRRRPRRRAGPTSPRVSEDASSHLSHPEGPTMLATWGT
jgi:glycerol kinase